MKKIQKGNTKKYDLGLVNDQNEQYDNSHQDRKGLAFAQLQLFKTGEFDIADHKKTEQENNNQDGRMADGTGELEFKEKQNRCNDHSGCCRDWKSVERYGFDIINLHIIAR